MFLVLCSKMMMMICVCVCVCVCVHRCISGISYIIIHYYYRYNKFLESTSDNVTRILFI
jgi:hypothetical protein